MRENFKFFSLIWRDILGDPGDLNQLSNLYDFRKSEENINFCCTVNLINLSQKKTELVQISWSYNIFAPRCCRSLKYQMVAPSGCKNIEIIKFKFVTNVKIRWTKIPKLFHFLKFFCRTVFTYFITFNWYFC